MDEFNEYLLLVKTVDGVTHQVPVEDDNAELASLWVRNADHGLWFNYEDGTTLKYINRQHIVSIDVLDVKAEAEAKEKRHKQQLEAVRQFNK